MIGPVMRARDLCRYYRLGGGFLREPKILRAVDGVSFDLAAGETLAIVGESGCGKSTLGRLCALVDAPTSGDLEIEDAKATGLPASERRALHRHVQMIFQNPFSSLNPRKTVAATLDEPLRLNTTESAADRRASVDLMLRKVGLQPEHAERYPHMLSGGQRQRVAIARALMLQPKVIVADEPLSALDVSVQAQIINLLADLRDEFAVAFIFISHDISVVRRLAHKAMVMYLGRSVEQGDAAAVLSDPAHPYTRALLAAVPSVRRPAGGRRRIRLSGELPSPLNPPSGCAFHTRCPEARPDCAERSPALVATGSRLVACPYAVTASIAGSGG
jgi:dipeptide transport system ATP-binding protein